MTWQRWFCFFSLKKRILTECFRYSKLVFQYYFMRRKTTNNIVSQWQKLSLASTECVAFAMESHYFQSHLLVHSNHVNLYIEKHNTYHRQDVLKIYFCISFNGNPYFISFDSHLLDEKFWFWFASLSFCKVCVKMYCYHEMNIKNSDFNVLLIDEL